MSSEATVTVVVAVRNGERFLAQCLDSIAAQTRRPDEVLLIDGASTDGTVAIAEGYPGVTVVPQDGLGIPGAYNQAIDLAAGDLIAWLSHDDTWEPTKLERQVEALAANPDWEYAVCRRRYFLEPGCEPPPGFRLNLLDDPPPVSYCMETLCARASVFDRVGRFDTEFAVAEDTDWFSRAKDLGVPHGHVDEPLVNRRVHDRNTSINDTDNSAHLLRLLRRSVHRKREQDQSAD